MSGGGSVSAILEIAARLREAESAGEQSAAEAVAAWLAFSIGGESFALPIASVVEVRPLGHLTPVPRAPAAVRGATNRRGHVLPVLDPGPALGLPATEIGPAARILVVEVERRLLGVLVERVGHIHRLRQRAISPPAAGERWHERAIGSCALDAGGRLVLLAPEALLAGEPDAEP